MYLQNRDLRMQQELAKAVGDGIAASITVGALLKYIPAIAALFTLIWTLMRIYEMLAGEGAIAKMIKRWHK